MPLPLTNPTRQAVHEAQLVLEQQPIYLDTETTGLDQTSEIVEIALVDWDGRLVFHSLVKPTQSIPLDAVHIHGITNEMVRTAPPWLTVWHSLRSLVIERRVAAYNAEFDFRLMRQSHSRYRLPWHEHISSFCIMRLYAQYRGDWDPIRRAYRFLSLETAAKQLGITLPNTHRAADDALLARSVLHAIAASGAA